MTRNGQAKFVIKHAASRTRRWYFTLVGRNGETLCTSELYTRKRDVLRAIDAVQLAAVEALVEDRAGRM